MLQPLAHFFEAELTEGFLELLLGTMSIAFQLDHHFRRNIEGFEGSYLFRSHDGAMVVSVSFAGGAMHVHHGAVASPTLVATFRDEKALMGLVLAPKPDILGAMLRQDVVLTGNLNYLYKFAYMAKRLQLMATCQV